MSTFTDITYKKNDDETWTEWSKRVPDNDDEKMYYIEDFIYAYCEYGGPTMARLVTHRLLGYAHICGDASLELSGVADMIPLLESKELLDAKIEEAYEAIRLKWESEKVPRCHEKEEEVYKKEGSFVSYVPSIQQLYSEGLKQLNKELEAAYAECSLELEDELDPQLEVYLNNDYHYRQDAA